MVKRKQNNEIAVQQPTEINALRALVKEFVSKIESIENEVDLLKEDRKLVIEEYSEKLDWKTLQAALKVAKIQENVERRDTFDLFMEVLDDPSL